MLKKSWLVPGNGSIQIQQLTPEYLDQAVDMMEEGFYKHENGCKAVDLIKNPAAIAELKALTRDIARDGVTVIAVDKSTNRVAGCAFNKLIVKNPKGQAYYFYQFAKKCQTHQARAFVTFMYEMDNLCNLFKFCNVDCLLEVIFMGVHPDYKHSGIGKKLGEVSVQLAQMLLQGVNIKVPISDQSLKLEPVPKIVSAVFTTFITQKIAKSLNFQTVAERSFSLFQHQGKSYTSIIGNGTPTATLAFTTLKRGLYLKGRL